MSAEDSSSRHSIVACRCLGPLRGWPAFFRLFTGAEVHQSASLDEPVLSKLQGERNRGLMADTIRASDPVPFSFRPSNLLGIRMTNRRKRAGLLWAATGAALCLAAGAALPIWTEAPTPPDAPVTF